MARYVAACLVLCASNVVLAQDAGKIEASSDIAKKYVAFWMPWFGTWEIRTDGEPPLTMTWHGEETPSGLYGTSRSEVRGRVIAHGLHAYDPAHKCWKVVEFGVEGESRPYTHMTRHIFVDAPTLGVVRAGVTNTFEEEVVRSDGTVVKTKGKCLHKTVEHDRIEFVLTDRTSNGEKLPDQTVIMERK